MCTHKAGGGEPEYLSWMLGTERLRRTHQHQGEGADSTGLLTEQHPWDLSGSVGSILSIQTDTREWAIIGAASLVDSR